MKKHYVTFFSPGTFVPETTTKEIDSWDVAKATEMARNIKERYDATPYGFQFFTRERGEEDFDSKEVAKSSMYFLGGEVLTLADVEARNDPKDSILIANMRGNGIERVVENRNSWQSVQPLDDGDQVLEFQP